MTNSEFLEIVKVVGQFAVIPLVGVLWRLSSSLKDLEILLYRDFVTKKELETWRKDL